MIEVRTWPLRPADYARLKLAGKIRFIPSEQDIAGDFERAADRDRERAERAVAEAEAIIAAARG